MTSSHKSESIGCTARCLLLVTVTSVSACAELGEPDEEPNQTGAHQALTVESVSALTADDTTQRSPRVDGDLVVYSAGDDESEAIFYIDLASSPPTPVAFDLQDQRDPDVSGRVLVWTDYDKSPPIVRAVSVDNTELFLTVGLAANTGGREHPRIGGRRIVYEYRSVPNALPAIYMTDLDAPLTLRERRVAPSDLGQTQPDISGDWVAFLSQPDISATSDLVLVNLVTGEQRVVADADVDPQSPSLDGNILAYQLTVDGETEIGFYDLACLPNDPTCEVWTILQLPGAQAAPAVAGRRIVFEDQSQGETITLYDIDELSLTAVPSDHGNPTPHMSGNRIVYIDQSQPPGGADDVWLATVSGPAPVLLPEIEVTPVVIGFGPVNVGHRPIAGVIVHNVGQAPLHVDHVSLVSPVFLLSRTSTGTVPAGGSLELELTFAPSATGTFTGQLFIDSDDPDEPIVEVSLSGTGVAVPPPAPTVTIDTILAAFDAAAANGELRGTGHSGLERFVKLQAVRLILVATRVVINHNAPGACLLLRAAHDRMDGVSLVKDWVEGPAAPTIAADIRTLRQSMSCP